MYKVIASASQGIPRATNPFCGSGLLPTVGDGSSHVRDSHVHKVMEDLGELPCREATVHASVPAPKTFPRLLSVTRFRGGIATVGSVDRLAPSYAPRKHVTP